MRRNIVAVAVAMLSTAAAHGVTNVEYCRGVLDASRAQALNHGMPWSEVSGEIKDALGDSGRMLVLDAAPGTVRPCALDARGSPAPGSAE